MSYKNTVITMNILLDALVNVIAENKQQEKTILLLRELNQSLENEGIEMAEELFIKEKCCICETVPENGTKIIKLNGKLICNSCTSHIRRSDTPSAEDIRKVGESGCTYSAEAEGTNNCSCTH